MKENSYRCLSFSIFEIILSEDAWWLDPTVTHSEGKFKLSENTTKILLVTSQSMMFEGPSSKAISLRGAPSSNPNRFRQRFEQLFQTSAASCFIVSIIRS
uniref:Uncharacterized protein n=1 Tax=Rhipilia penicilloides TaxID=1979422 RepID=A0A2P0QHS0_9CHLO|nr:hypothetical protein [Rhipilia penicilloides]ARO74303.1 hypothetical protein [Rhipilia penicilloides]